MIAFTIGPPGREHFHTPHLPLVRRAYQGRPIQAAGRSVLADTTHSIEHVSVDVLAAVLVEFFHTA
jgi:hypothetical protein